LCDDLKVGTGCTARRLNRKTGGNGCEILRQLCGALARWQVAVVDRPLESGGKPHLTASPAFVEERDHAMVFGATRESALDGISETTVQNWVSRAEVDEGVKPGLSSSEQENEVLRRAAAYLSQGSLPK
jgi:hypothetical protein